MRKYSISLKHIGSVLTGDYFKNYILRTVEPDLATQWVPKSNEEISELYREWCDYHFERKKHPENSTPEPS